MNALDSDNKELQEAIIQDFLRTSENKELKEFLSRQLDKVRQGYTVIPKPESEDDEEE